MTVIILKVSGSVEVDVVVVVVVAVTSTPIAPSLIFHSTDEVATFLGIKVSRCIYAKLCHAPHLFLVAGSNLERISRRTLIPIASRRLMELY